MLDDSTLAALVDAQMAELRATFDLFDIDHDGRLDADELHAALVTLGQEIDLGEVQRLIAAVDPVGARALDFVAFVALVEPEAPGTHPDADLQEAFRVLDADGDGFIDLEELRDAVRRNAVDDTTQEIAMFLAEADDDGDGRLSFAEFARSQGER